MEKTRSPMLAKKYEAINPKNIKFPYLIQRKYNGLRCIIEYGEFEVGVGLFSKIACCVKMFSKTGKEYYVEHLWNKLVDLYKESDFKNIILDGELYVHGESINIIKSRVPMFINGNTLSETSLEVDPVKYIIYDILDKDHLNMSQVERISKIRDIFGKYMWDDLEDVLLADTQIVNNYEEALEYRDKFINEGFEGAMLRSPNAIYQFKRTSDLIKLKRIWETECLILDIIDDGFKSDRENIGFILQNDINDEIFKCTPGDDGSWTNSYKRNIFDNKYKYIGLYATITFRERSGVKKVPFHANVKTIRDYE